MSHDHDREGLTDEALLDDLDRVCRDCGHAATVDEYREAGQFDYKRFHSRFGSWGEALDAAGWRPSTMVEPHRLPNALEAMDPEDLGLSPDGGRAND